MIVKGRPHSCHSEDCQPQGVCGHQNQLEMHAGNLLVPPHVKKYDDKNKGRGANGAQGIDRLPKRHRRQNAKDYVPDHSPAYSRHHSQNHHAKNVHFFLDGRHGPRQSEGHRSNHIQHKKHIFHESDFLFLSPCDFHNGSAELS